LKGNSTTTPLGGERKRIRKPDSQGDRKILAVFAAEEVSEGVGAILADVWSTSGGGKTVVPGRENNRNQWF